MFDSSVERVITVSLYTEYLVCDQTIPSVKVDISCIIGDYSEKFKYITNLTESA